MVTIVLLLLLRLAAETMNYNNTCVKLGKGSSTGSQQSTNNQRVNTLALAVDFLLGTG